MQKILYIATRNPLPVSAGRHRMIVQSLEMLRETYQVGLLYFDKEAAGEGQLAQQLGLSFARPLHFPSVAEVALNMTTRTERSVQENLFYSRRAASSIRRTIASFAPDLVVADMLRCGQFVERCGVPTVLEMDDLLSGRYERLAAAPPAGDSLLGTFSAILPKGVAAAVDGHLRPLVLRYETKKIRRRERAAVHAFDAVTLVSPCEARQLREVTGSHTVYPVPPTVGGVVGGRSARLDSQCRLLFVGNLRYNQNLASVRYIVQEVLPLLERRGLDYVFDIGGSFDDKARSLAAGNDRVRLLGFVESMTELFLSHDVFLTPIVFGSGIKTKILDAMAHGLPVVTNDVGREGIPCVDGEHCLVANDAHGIAEKVVALHEDRHLPGSLSHSAAQLIADHFLFDKIKSDYLGVVSGVLQKH